MSTRAVYTFIDRNGRFSVYGHHDGYPAGAAAKIKAATVKAWGLPRFEASEFAAAFVAANKDGAGSVYLTESHGRHCDLAYRYEVRFDGADLCVKAFKSVGDWEKPAYHCIYSGTLSGFASYAAAEEA